MPASSFKDKSSVRKVKFPFLLPGGKVTLLGSCNGLVFLVVQINFGEYFYTCNPSTGLFKQLPSPGSDEDHLSYIGGGGVDYVSATDDYKVLTAYFEEYEEVEVIQMFSLRAQGWTRIEDPGETGSLCLSYSVALSNEALHWLNYEQDQIFAFDLAKEELRTMLVPNFFQVPSPVLRFLMEGACVYRFIGWVLVTLLISG
ncbi:uncharacterized protein LOC112199711 [Rosa chinensis]|uniref:uncharacterized protein LOC112199711 n=1 Tax=Rosa chinensis TaxID=74649 RepID=UPI000D08779B|nr:uncharacterized protein LOC112199711 [Rosa chinensis]